MRKETYFRRMEGIRKAANKAVTPQVSIPTRSKMNSDGEIINPTPKDVAEYNKRYKTLRRGKRVRPLAKKAMLPLAKKAVKQTPFVGGVNFDKKTGVTKIPGIKFGMVEKSPEEKWVANRRKKPSTGKGVGY